MTTIERDLDPTDLDPGPLWAWWFYLVTGIAWVVLSLALLGFQPDSVTLIGYLTGIALMLLGFAELGVAAIVAGWRWLHATFGVIFVIGGVMALLSPFQTFGILALLIGWYLVAKGMLDIVASLVDRDRIDMWGLMLFFGVIQVAIGVWAIGSPARSAWLLVLWVGLATLTRGITDIVLAVRLHKAGGAA